MMNITVEVKVRDEMWRKGTPTTSRKIELTIPESLVSKIPLAEIVNTATQEAINEYINSIPEVTEREEE